MMCRVQHRDQRPSTAWCDADSRSLTSRPYIDRPERGQRHEHASLDLLAPSPDHAAAPKDSESVCNGESGRADRRGGTQR